MLAAIGVASLEELFDRQIPAAVRLQRALDLPAGMAEQDVYAHLRALAARNTSAEDEVTFLGAGMYDHYVPAVIDMLMGRSEFLTPYTPYQPEISQGGLQVMFEYQTAISELTGLPVSNATRLRGPAAPSAAAAYLAKLANGKREGRRLARRAPALARGAAHAAPPATATRSSRSACATASPTPTPGPPRSTRTRAPSSSSSRTSSAPSRTPPRWRARPRTRPRSSSARTTRSRSASSSRRASAASTSPSGEGQTLGNRLDFGGPSFGFFAATEAYLRRMPGRIAGETRDVDGRRGFVLTLQTREQHIRREKATSNICTAQALNALAGVVYLTWLGRRGLVELGELLLQRTHYARETLTALDGVEALHEQPVVREFAVRLDAPVDRVIARCQDAGVNPGFALGREYDEHPDGLLVAITEQRSRADIDRLADVLGTAVAAERQTAGVGA